MKSEWIPQADRVPVPFCKWLLFELTREGVDALSDCLDRLFGNLKESA